MVVLLQNIRRYSEWIPTTLTYRGQTLVLIGSIDHNTGGCDNNAQTMALGSPEDSIPSVGDECVGERIIYQPTNNVW